MVFPAASAVTASHFPITPLKEKFCLLHSSFLINVRLQHVSVTHFTKFPRMQHFQDSTKFTVLLNSTKDKLWEVIPGSVKQFPWKKAEKVALHKLLALGKETLKWTLLAYFALSCPTDILYSLSRNKELVIPLGLFVGCMITYFLDEISGEILSNYKDDVFTWKLLGISCFFVLVKIFAAYFLGAYDFLLHIANGGLMQLLWNWKMMPNLEGKNPLPGNGSATENTDG